MEPTSIVIGIIFLVIIAGLLIRSRKQDVEDGVSKPSKLTPKPKPEMNDQSE